MCISLYPEDLETIDQKVEALRARGYAMNKSKLVRIALDQLKTKDVDIMDVIKSGGK